MKISVIFPTYQRAKNLAIAFDSLLQQTLLPFETIIVDQSTDKETSTLCTNKKYQTLNIRYFHYDGKSLPQSRKFGIEKVSESSDIISFFDDDVGLQPEYLAEVSKFIANHPKALGCGGKILNFPQRKGFIEKIGNMLFRTQVISHEFCATNAQEKNPNNIQAVTTLIGCNMNFRKSVKDLGCEFPVRMRRNAYTEDTIYTYQISNKHPNSLFYVPSAEIYHYEAPSGRILNIQKFRQVLYNKFIFRKTHKFSMITFYRWTLGFLIRSIMKNENKINIVKDFFRAHTNIRKHSKKIQQDHEYTNMFIYDE